MQQKGDPSPCLIKANMCSCGSRFATNTHNSETSDLRPQPLQGRIYGRSAALFHSIRASLVEVAFSSVENLQALGAYQRLRMLEPLLSRPTSARNPHCHMPKTKIEGSTNRQTEIVRRISDTPPPQQSGGLYRNYFLH